MIGESDKLAARAGHDSLQVANELFVQRIVGCLECLQRFFAGCEQDREHAPLLVVCRLVAGAVFGDNGVYRPCD